MTRDDNHDSPAATVFGWTTHDWAIFVSGFAIIAGAIGAGVPVVAGWASRFPTPVQEIFELADSFDWRIAVPAFTLVGAVFGGYIAIRVLTDLALITVTDNVIRLKRAHESLVVPRSEVSAVFLDGNKFVVLGADSAQRIRTEFERASERQVRNGARRHGYPWFDTDPHADLFRPWEPGHDNLQPAAHALLKMRATALEQESWKHVEELDHEFLKLGYVARETKTAQYWRHLKRP